MKILEIKDLQREEGQIFYLRKYTGNVIIELPTGVENTQINFSIETSPLGEKTFTLSIVSPISYPLLSVRKAILEYLFVEEQEGRLPC